MELATTPMTERQRKYRENYRERVASQPKVARHQCVPRFDGYRFEMGPSAYRRLKVLRSS